MTRSMTTIAAESDLLCEYCGYTLNGLPDGALCPECGKPAADSSPARRHIAGWEQPGPFIGSIARFIQTTLLVLFRPTHFYRTLATRHTRRRSRQFAGIYWVLVSMLFGLAAYYHFRWYVYIGSIPHAWDQYDRPVVSVLALTGLSYVMLLLITRVAATLTSWEAAYRGLRLPLAVVLRGLDYHAAHYLPVAVVGAGTVLGYQFLLERHWVSSVPSMNYLYILCGEVLVCSLYLFWTYWIGMRNMMYANA